MNKLFFDSGFRLEFDWKEKFHLRVGSVTPQSKKQISDGLRDMSPESIRYRFLGSKKEFSEKELQYLTVLDGWNHYAIGIEEREKMKRGVAIIRLVRSSDDPKEAEVAITIIDEYQKMGLGTLLLDLTILAATEREIERLSFTFLPQNDGIQKLIERAGVPVRGPQSHDYIQLFLELKTIDTGRIKARLQKTLPETETFHLKT